MAYSGPLPPLKQARYPRKPCEGDICGGKGQPTYFCNFCDCSFCDECWDKERAHKPGKKGPDGYAHEKEDLLVVERYRDILEPSSDVHEQQALHRDDEDTTWFGIGRDMSDAPVFEDYARYAALMAGSLTAKFPVRYPQLVSFIGQTGAGKSTLVNMLISHEEMKTNLTTTSTFATPVVGSINDSVPTSGDVHLYAEPGTIFTGSPLLYADCEGLEGGESLPMAEKHKIQDKEQSQALVRRKPIERATSPHKRRRPKKGRRRNISWAIDSETSKREYAVTELYPRLLYTFSDVVVFVLRNSKTFESAVLTKLVQWASVSMEKSLNQPALPHAIIALNATDMAIDSNQWETQHSTDKLLSDVQDAVRKIPMLQERAAQWQDKGRIINNTKDLLYCYYSSVTVIRIPVKGRYMLMDQQVGKLREEIVFRSNQSHYTKARIRMLSNGDDLQMYLQAAFDHFAQDLDTPFNFVEVALRSNPIPLNFSGNILKLAIAIRDHPAKPLPPVIFKLLAPMVASCIMLDIHRHRRLGIPNKLLEDHYMHYCQDAYDDFCDRYWPCSYANKRGRCVGVQQGHSDKGHQNAAGKIIAAGDYQSSFSESQCEDKWISNLKQEMNRIQTLKEESSFGRSNANMDSLATQLHRRLMVEFYDSVKPASYFISHSTCFCCLRELPEHALVCGHILCTLCIQAYGSETLNSHSRFEMAECPLHPHEERWKPPTSIQLKPALAGVRILCLDGGGMRGIVELEVLDAIRRQLPSKIPIQSFFDLIVGTSTGGIIALGLGVEGWTVESCIERFHQLCDKAFTPREMHGVPILQTLAAFNHDNSMYKTRPLLELLKDSFSEDGLLFGGPQEQEHYVTKVAVTSTRDTGQQPVVLANYNRPNQKSDLTASRLAEYKFERADKPAHELNTWEAARATSAAPSYFKVHKSERNGCGYMDGALYHNNPVRVANIERKLIWPDTKDLPPDLLLSIGTSCSAEIFNKARSTSFESEQSFAVPELSRDDRDAQPKSKMKQLFKLLKNRIDNILDTEVAWRNFVSDAVGTDPNLQGKYQRINPQIGFEPPRLDETSRLADLQRVVQHKLTKDAALLSQTREVAHRLIASCFYFDKSTQPMNSDFRDEDLTCYGEILCRFPSGSPEIRALGEYLRKASTAQFQPYFVIENSDSFRPIHKKNMDTEFIQQMTMNASFELAADKFEIANESIITTISLGLAPKEEYPISGFPRILVDLDNDPKPLVPSITEPLKRHRPKILILRDRPSLVEIGPQTDGHSETALRAVLKGDRALMRLLNDEAWQNSQTDQYPRCSICTDELPFSFYHCYTCKDDKFDICERCYMDGKWCLDLNHRLLKTPSLTKPRSFRVPGEKYYFGEDGKMVSFITAAKSPAGSRNSGFSIQTKDSRETGRESTDAASQLVPPEFKSLAEATNAAVSKRAKESKGPGRDSNNPLRPFVVPRFDGHGGEAWESANLLPSAESTDDSAKPVPSTKSTDIRPEPTNAPIQVMTHTTVTINEPVTPEIMGPIFRMPFEHSEEAENDYTDDWSDAPEVPSGDRGDRQPALNRKFSWEE